MASSRVGTSTSGSWFQYYNWVLKLQRIIYDAFVAFSASGMWLGDRLASFILLSQGSTTNSISSKIFTTAFFRTLMSILCCKWTQSLLGVSLVNTAIISGVNMAYRTSLQRGNASSQYSFCLFTCSLCQYLKILTVVYSSCKRSVPGPAPQFRVSTTVLIKNQ